MYGVLYGIGWQSKNNHFRGQTTKAEQDKSVVFWHFAIVYGVSAPVIFYAAVQTTFYMYTIPVEKHLWTLDPWTNRDKNPFFLFFFFSSKRIRTHKTRVLYYNRCNAGRRWFHFCTFSTPYSRLKVIKLQKYIYICMYTIYVIYTYHKTPQRSACTVLCSNWQFFYQHEGCATARGWICKIIFKFLTMRECLDRE